MCSLEALGASGSFPAFLHHRQGKFSCRRERSTKSLRFHPVRCGNLTLMPHRYQQTWDFPGCLKGILILSDFNNLRHCSTNNLLLGDNQTAATKILNTQIYSDALNFSFSFSFREFQGKKFSPIGVEDKTLTSKDAHGRCGFISLQLSCIKH